MEELLKPFASLVAPAAFPVGVERRLEVVLVELVELELVELLPFEPELSESESGTSGGSLLSSSLLSEVGDGRGLVELEVRVLVVVVRVMV